MSYPNSGAAGGANRRQFRILGGPEGYSLYVYEHVPTVGMDLKGQLHHLEWEEANERGNGFITMRLEAHQACNGPAPLRMRRATDQVVRDVPLSEPAPGDVVGIPTVMRPPYAYTVSWTIDVEADSFEEAAHRAAQSMYPGTTATVFTVTDSEGTVESIDIAAEPE